MLVIKKDLLNCSNCIIFNLNDLYPDPEVSDGSVPIVTIFFPFKFWIYNTICISEVLTIAPTPYMPTQLSI